MRHSFTQKRCAHALLLGGLLTGIALALLSRSGESQSDEPAAVPNADARPVILLTGFEPFGGRPQNASWEGVKSLDGREFHGHRIVCRELPVVWGAPLEHFRKWTDELNPVAVFSFGEGRPHGFDIETRAFNQRGGFPDNNAAPPPAAVIVADGPESVEASIDHAALHRALVGQGHPVHVSTSAGRYLCEECLYSLEYVRGGRDAGLDVMFCHVPPLGAEIEEQAVSAEYIQEYVEDLLEAWYALAGLTEDSAADPGAEREARSESEPDDPRRAGVETFINLYFSSWSDRDLETYGECFAPGSCVQYVEDDRILLYQLQPFLDLQARVHRQSPERLRETPESIDIRFERDLARVVVYWKLTAGSRMEFGYDHFTLLKGSEGWKIVNLIFYSTPPESE